MAYAKYREAQAAVATLQTMFGYTRIIAPFDGVITGRFADPGALIRAGGGDIGVDETSGMISPGATEGAGGHREGGGPILTLAEIDKLRVYIYVPEASYPFIHVGTPASLHFDEFPDRVFIGTVARYASSLDLATRTMLTEVDINNPKRLVYPRSYAHVTIELVRHPDALSVPASAIQGSGEAARLLVVDDGRLVEVPVKTGINNGAYVEVTSGLSPQSLVVATYSNNLTPGQQVDCRIQNGRWAGYIGVDSELRLSRTNSQRQINEQLGRLMMKSLRNVVMSRIGTSPGARSRQRGGSYGGITRRYAGCGARSGKSNSAGLTIDAQGCDRDSFEISSETPGSRG